MALKRAVAALLEMPRRCLVEQKVRRRLWPQRDDQFSFLERAQVPGTNNLAEGWLRLRERVVESFTCILG